MRTPRGATLQLLRALMIGALVLPAALFAYVAWSGYHSTTKIVDDRIDRSLDVLHEHALKVLKTAELVMDEIADATRGLSDREIRANDARLHARFKRMADALPQVQSIWLLDRDGYALVTSYFFPAPRSASVADRDFFQAQVAADAGTYVGAVLEPRLVGGPPFFSLSRRRRGADGKFAGVITVSMLPSDFEKFYAEIGRDTGVYFAMIRVDGAFLTRYPEHARAGARLDPTTSMLASAVRRDPQRGIFTGRGQIDGIERRFSYRKLEGYPVYLVAGLETSAIRSAWLASTATHLVFGIPATLLLFVLLGLARRRTKLLYAEADRREAAEAALRQSQRLEAIGRLTGGVAHDFNNLLMVIVGSVERLQMKPREDKDARYLDMIATAAKRGETLTRQLLSFSRQQALNPQAIDLAKWIPELSELVRRSLREDVEVTIDTAGLPCPVKVDPGEFELAVLNICVNARDAMPNGGTLAVAARKVTLDGDPAVEGLAGEFAAVSFADTGAGIPAELLPRVIEPFFTTKAAAKGTGLGLSQVYGFARQSGGTAVIASTPGRGTVVTIYLPCAAFEPAAPAAAEERPAAPPGRKTVLVVEDNLAVAEVCKSYLDQLGYAVEFATGPRDALQFLDGAPRVDLLLSDIVMPGMSGHELAHEVRRRRPGLPVVLMTGFSDSAEEVVRDGFRVIRKPFDRATLERALAAELQQKTTECCG